MGELYLVRHGQASFGSNNYDALSPVGEKQAEVVAEHLRSEVVVDHVIAGSLKRQKDTAQAYLKQLQNHHGVSLELAEDEGFNEFEAEKIMQYFLPYILEKRADLREKVAAAEADGQGGGAMGHFNTLFFPIIDAWMAGENPSADIETFASFKSRVNAAMDRLMTAAAQQEIGKKVAVFTSGGTISAIMQRALQTPDEAIFQLNYKIANASISKFFFKEKRLGLSYFNNFSHLSFDDRGLVTFK